MNNKQSSIGKTLFISALLVFFISGCYTVLMTTKDSSSASRRSSSSSIHMTGGNFTSTLDYNQNCFSCHSQAELDDRDFDMTRSGINIVHGIPYSVSLWVSPSINRPDNPYGWNNPSSSSPWWVPPAVSTPSTSGTSSVESGNRRRESGSTRGGETPRRERETTTVATPTPTPTSQQSTPSNPAPVAQPVVSTAPSTSTPAPQTAPAQQEVTRSRSSSDNPSRKSGSTRGEDKP